MPKTESAAHLEILDRLLAETGKPTRLVALIESAQGLAACEAIAAATPRLEALLFGGADMSADLGAATAWAPLKGQSSTERATALIGLAHPRFP